MGVVKSRRGEGSSFSGRVPDRSPRDPGRTDTLRVESVFGKLRGHRVKGMDVLPVLCLSTEYRDYLPKWVNYVLCAKVKGRVYFLYRTKDP